MGRYEQCEAWYEKYISAAVPDKTTKYFCDYDDVRIIKQELGDYFLIVDINHVPIETPINEQDAVSLIWNYTLVETHE